MTAHHPPPSPDVNDGPGGWVRRGWLVFVLAWGLAFLLSNGLYVFDAKARHSSSQWLWAGTSPAAGHRDVHLVHMMPGVDGTPHVFYSIGQQLLYVPVDVAVINLVPGNDPASRQLRTWLVVMLLFPALAGAATVAVFGLLGALGHSRAVATWASLVAVAGSSIVPATVLGLESSEELLYLAGGLWAAVAVGRRTSVGAMVALALAAAMAVMLRLPHLAYAAGMATVVVMAGGRAGRHRFLGLAAVATGVALALVVDRVFHHARFGDWTSNYNQLAESALIARDPTIEPGFFFSFPWQTGLMLELFGPGKSVFLYEPVLTLALGLAAWLRWSPAQGPAGDSPVQRRAVLVALGVVLVPQMLFYASYIFTFSLGHWGNRFVAAPVVVLAALLLAAVLGRPGWLLGVRRLVLAAGIAACLVTTVLASFFRPDFDVVGDGMFEVVGRGNTNANIQLSMLARQPYAFHAGRRVVMVSHRLTGVPALADAPLMPEVLWTPNYWPFQLRFSRVGGLMPGALLAMMPWVWAALWGAWIAVVARAVWRDASPRAPGP